VAVILLLVFESWKEIWMVCENLIKNTEIACGTLIEVQVREAWALQTNISVLFKIHSKGL
jgi:hypothetical protein